MTQDEKKTAVKPPLGYDYLAPVGYKAGENPTFPSKLYEAAEEILVVTPTVTPTTTPTPAHQVTEGYLPPSGYDYSPPKGYSPDKNPTFPEKLYTAPKLKSKKKKKQKAGGSDVSLPAGYDYAAPPGYKAGENPTFPQVSPNYLTPSSTVKPTGYSPPAGYDYSPPLGYKPEENPTFPSSLYDPPPAPPVKPSPGYLPPQGYDYQAPKGYQPDVNPTFPSSLYEEPKPRQPESSYIPAEKPISSGYKPPQGYDYNPPPGYKAEENPTFPAKKYPPTVSSLYVEPTEASVGYKPPEGYDYQPPRGYEASENPTFPEHSTSKYLPPSLTKVPKNYPKHKFNIIIKNRNKPDTSISITPQPPVLSLNHGLPGHQVGLSSLDVWRRSLEAELF